MITYQKSAAWLGGFLIFIMTVAAMSALLKRDETGKTIRGISKGFENLFKGVFQ